MERIPDRGVFFKAQDFEVTATWYAEKLGVAVDPTTAGDVRPDAFHLQARYEYFDPSSSPHDQRPVDDFDAMLAQLRARA